MAENKKGLSSGESVLDSTAAKNILANAFQAAGMKSSDIPLEALTSYANYRMNRLIPQKIISILMLVLLLIVPYFFISAKFTLAEDEERSLPGYPVYRLTMTSSLPAKSITVSIGDDAVPMEEAGDGAYALLPSENGDMTATVTLRNGQTYSQTVTVTGSDLEAPVLVSDSLSSDSSSIVFQVEDSGTGIDTEGIYAETASGSTVLPLSVEEPADGAAAVTFSYPEEDMTACIPDLAGNVLKLQITPTSTIVYK